MLEFFPAHCKAQPRTINPTWSIPCFFLRKNAFFMFLFCFVKQLYRTVSQYVRFRLLFLNSKRKTVMWSTPGMYSTPSMSSTPGMYSTPGMSSTPGTKGFYFFTLFCCEKMKAKRVFCSTVIVFEINENIRRICFWWIRSTKYVYGVQRKDNNKYFKHQHSSAACWCTKCRRHFVRRQPARATSDSSSKMCCVFLERRKNPLNDSPLFPGGCAIRLCISCHWNTREARSNVRE